MKKTNKAVRSIEEITKAITWEENTISYQKEEIARYGERLTANLEKKNYENIDRYAKEIVSAGKEIKKAKKEIRELKEELKQAEIKESKSSNDVIDQFLANWREQAFKYYTNLRAEYKELRATDFPVTEESLKSITRINRKRKYSDEQIEGILTNWSELAKYEKENIQAEVNSAGVKEWRSKHHKSELAVIEQMYDSKFLDNLLDKEVVSKKKAFIAKVEEKAGKIVSTKSLEIGVDGSLNGTVEGEVKTVTVTTIYAGGYNIQCLHYRVLVK